MFKQSRYLGKVMEILQMFKGKNSTSVISLSGTMARPQNSSDKKKKCVSRFLRVCASVSQHFGWASIHGEKVRADRGEVQKCWHYFIIHLNKTSLQSLCVPSKNINITLYSWLELQPQYTPGFRKPNS